MDFDLFDKVEGFFNAGRIRESIGFLESIIGDSGVEKVKGFIGAKFSNSPHSIADSINEFIEFCRKDFEPKAVYLEMIGFDINYEYWNFDFFGFEKCMPPDADLDWLCDWKNEFWESVDLTGLEQLQEYFRWSNEYLEDYEQIDEKVRTAAILLVMVRFVCLIEEAFATGRIEPGITILATAHEFDIIGRFES